MQTTPLCCRPPFWLNIEKGKLRSILTDSSGWNLPPVFESLLTNRATLYGDTLYSYNLHIHSFQTTIFLSGLYSVSSLSSPNSCSRVFIYLGGAFTVSSVKGMWVVPHVLLSILDYLKKESSAKRITYLYMKIHKVRQTASDV